MSIKLIADSGSTKTEWCLLKDGQIVNTIITQGLSPYFLNHSQIVNILNSELKINMEGSPDQIFFYGTGCSNPVNISLIKGALENVFEGSESFVTHDLMAAARSLCGNNPGIIAILGTGSNSCYYDGVNIIKNSPGLGFILGDEGSGAYLGKKVIQYYLYNTFEEDLIDTFNNKYKLTSADILNSVYKEPLPNRYLAKFVEFLIENRGHFMIENIIEDGLNDFFFTHLYKYPESWSHPINFVGGVANQFKDVIADLCNSYELQLGEIQKNPMAGLIKFHEAQPKT